MGKKSRRTRPAALDNNFKEVMEEALDESFQRSTAGELPEHPLAERDRRYGLDPITNHVKGRRRRPCCAVCGADDARYKCNRCNAESYCGRECQAHAWRKGGHKDKSTSSSPVKKEKNDPTRAAETRQEEKTRLQQLVDFEM